MPPTDTELRAELPNRDGRSVPVDTALLEEAMPGVAPDSNGSPPFEFRPLQVREELGRVRRTLASALQAVCFWLAIAVPFLYVPFLLHGFTGPNETIAFGVLLGLNVVALFVGHEHQR